MILIFLLELSDISRDVDVGGGGYYRSYSFSYCLDEKCKLFGIIRIVRFVFQLG